MAGWTTRQGYHFSSLLCSLILFFLSSSNAIPSGLRVVARDREGDDLVVPSNRLIAEAIYRSQIFCPGTIPYSAFDWPVRILQDRNPEDVYTTVRSLCGLFVLGGFPVDNVGMYCAFSARAGPFVAFSRKPNVGMWREADEEPFWVSVALLCQTRCHCLPDARSDFPADFLYTLPAPEVAETEAGPTNNLIPNAVPSTYSSDMRDGGYILQFQVAPFIDIIYNPDLSVDTYTATPVYYMMAPKCTGPLPPFSLPWPFTAYDVHDIQGLCAALWFGGSWKGNVGGFCNQRTGKFEVNMHTAQ